MHDMKVDTTTEGSDISACLDHEAYPDGFRDLDADTCREALRRAAVLVGQGYREALALRMATVLASEWADNGKPSKRALPGPSLHVLHDGAGWAVCAENDSESSAVFDRFEDALHRAHDLAIEHSAAVYVYDSSGALIDKYERFGGAIDEGYRVMPFDGSWAVKLGGADGSFEMFETKREALDEARKRAKADSATLVVHYQDGSVQRELSYQ